jgi:hypothetical protein
MSELRRSANDDAARTIAEARSEADELRATARSLLAEARAEVAVLTAHRDAIARELGDLSGVIDALAVPVRGKSSDTVNPSVDDSVDAGTIVGDPAATHTPDNSDEDR